MLRRIIELEKDNRVLLFLLSMIALLGSSPFFIDGFIRQSVFTIGLSIVLLAGIHAISEEKHTRWWGVIIGSIAVLLGLVETFIYEDRIIRLIYLILTCLFFTYTAVVIVAEVVRDKKISQQMIYGSIAGYLLLGLSGGVFFAIMDLIDSASFSIDLATHGIHTFIYFSFVTLATLGYGDILPTAPYAQMFAVLLSIAGQFYLTILVAMLVGKYIKK